MEQLANPTLQDAPVIVCLLEERLLGYQALAQSLQSCPEAYIQLNLTSIEQSIAAQTSCCSRIRAAETAIRKYAETYLPSGEPLYSGLAPAARERAKEVLLETAFLSKTIAHLNQTYRRMVQKVAHTNAILTNLYANVPVYGDPRATALGRQRWVEG